MRMEVYTFFMCYAKENSSETSQKISDMAYSADNS